MHVCLQKKQRKEASVAHRGHYIFKIDACDCVPVDGHVLEYVPELTSMATRNSVQLPLSDSTAASIGCKFPSLPASTSSYSQCVLTRVSLIPLLPVCPRVFSVWLPNSPKVSGARRQTTMLLVSNSDCSGLFEFKGDRGLPTFTLLPN